MRTRSLIVLLIFVVLVAAAVAMHTGQGGRLHRLLAAIHGR